MLESGLDGRVTAFVTVSSEQSFVQEDYISESSLPVWNGIQQLYDDGKSRADASLKPNDPEDSVFIYMSTLQLNIYPSLLSHPRPASAHPSPQKHTSPQLQKDTNRRR
jgi:hypothetical protein